MFDLLETFSVMTQALALRAIDMRQIKKMWGSLLLFSLGNVSILFVIPK